MANYVTTDWRTRRTTKANTFTKILNGDGSFTHIPDEGNILEPGTPINATNMNKIEEGIYNANQKLDNNGADAPIPDLAIYDNIQDMLSNINATVYKAHINGGSTTINFPIPLSRYFLIRFTGSSSLALTHMNGVDLRGTDFISRKTYVNQSFGTGLNSQTYGFDDTSGEGLKLTSSWGLSGNPTEGVPPPNITFYSGGSEISTGYIFNRAHAAPPDNKLSLYATGHCYDVFGAHMNGGMSYFSSVLYSTKPNTLPEFITSLTFEVDLAYANLEFMHTPSFAALMELQDYLMENETFEKTEKETKGVK